MQAAPAQPAAVQDELQVFEPPTAEFEATARDTLFAPKGMSALVHVEGCVVQPFSNMSLQLATNAWRFALLQSVVLLVLSRPP